MKERFWSAYYWLIISYLGLFLVILISSKYNYKDIYYEDTSSWYQNQLLSKARQAIYFDFIGYQSTWCSDLKKYDYELNTDEETKICKAGKIEVMRDMYVKNYHAILVVFLMTLIRWISIGKHIWQRP